MTGDTSSPRMLIAGNWKMNGTRANLAEARAVDSSLKELGADPGLDVMICPPFTLISSMIAEMGQGPVQVGGQDCHPVVKGAHTGDISAEMLADLGASAVIVGHSERRADHGEDDDLVRQKAEAAWRAGLTAIICVGETEAQRDAGDTLKVVIAQIENSVPEGATAATTLIAYEPVWAIGTGRTPTPEDVAEMHAEIRKTLSGRFGNEASAMRILYGGSVKPGNARELMAVENVDGALVGGASLQADDFIGIITASR